MKVPKTITKPNYVFGVPQVDFYILLGYLMGSMFLVNLLLTFGIHLKYWGYLFVIFSTWGLYIYLRWGSRQNHPGFMFSWFSYKFLQPGKIIAQGFKIEVKNSDNGK